MKTSTEQEIIDLTQQLKFKQSEVSILANKLRDAKEVIMLKQREELLGKYIKCGDVVGTVINIMNENKIKISQPAITVNKKLVFNIIQLNTDVTYTTMTEEEYIIYLGNLVRGEFK